MSSKSEMIIYQTEDGLTKVNVTFEEDTVWLSLEQMAQLFQRDKSVISRHIKKIYTEGELSREGTVAKNATVQLEGQRNVERTVEYYNLDVIITAVAPGTALEYVVSAFNGWQAVKIGSRVGWVSGEYSEITTE